MSRFNSWLNELQPEMFVELSPELAAERGIDHGGWLTVRSARGAIEARAMVTRRLRPLLVEGRIVHQIGMPFHWGFAGETVGGNANDLTVARGRPEREHARGQGVRLPGRGRPARRHRSRDADAESGAPGRRAIPSPTRRAPPSRRGDSTMATRNGAGGAGSRRRPVERLAARRCCTALVEPFRRGAAAEPAPATGFYTDTTLCIGCKACEVACKQWNQLPADGFDFTGNSYDNTGELSATTWRHVKFIEQFPADGPHGLPGRVPICSIRAAG